MTLVVECVPAPGGVAVDPCGTVGGVALAPTVTDLGTLGGLDFSHAQGLFVWALAVVVTVFGVGFAVGSIMRLIRAA